MLTLLLTLTGCGQGTVYHDVGLWNATPVAANDGLYIALPDADRVVRVTPDGAWVSVDLGGSTVERMILTPDGDKVVVFASYPVCDIDDPDLKTFDDCWDEGGEVVTEKELLVLQDGAVVGDRLPYEGHYNALTFTNAGTRAVAWTDLSDGSIPTLSGLDNLTQIAVLDLDRVALTDVAVGDVVDSIQFDEADTKALVLSRSQVIVLEMATGDYNREVTFPLALDVDAVVRPTSVVLTPDGRYAMLTVESSDDLFVLDLQTGNQSINIVSLAGVPSDMQLSSAAARTAVVYGGLPRVDILDHEYFEVEMVELEESATDLVVSEGQVLAYNAVNNGVKDVYRVDLATGELTEYRAENPLESLVLSPDGLYGVGVAKPEGGFTTGVDGLMDANWGITLFDMASDDSLHLIAAAYPLDLAFRGEGPDAEVLVLVQDVDELQRVNLSSGTKSTVELEAPPLHIGALGDQFWITHDSPLGMVTFLEADGDTVEVVNFASAGLLPAQDLLVHRTGGE